MPNAQPSVTGFVNSTMKTDKVTENIYTEYKTIGQVRQHLEDIGFIKGTRMKEKGQVRRIFFRGPDAVEIIYRFFVSPSLIIMYCDDGKNWRRVNWQDIPKSI